MGAALKAIRAGIKARLLNKTAAGARVSTNRADRVWQDGLPAIVIYTKTEQVEQDQQAPPTYKRTARISLDILLQDGSGMPLDDDADDLAEVVEQLMFLDPRLVAECPELVNAGHQVGYDILVQDGGDQLICGARITWEFVYFQDANVGDLAELAPWKTARTTYNLGPSGMAAAP
jgi:hypothetical protein